MKYYSQNGQDFWVITTFKNFRKGYFVDIGAADGIFISNTFLLEKEFEWTGICVEPNEYIIPLLKQNRHCIINTDVIGNDNEEVKYMEYKDNIHEQMFSHITNNGISLYNAQLPTSGMTIIDKKSISLNTLLNKYNAPDIIHYLSVDVNNNDIEIVEDFLKKNTQRKILAMTIEHNNNSKAEKLNQFLSGYEYILSSEHYQDNQYVINNVEKYL